MRLALLRSIWIAITLAGLGLAAWAFWWEPSSLTVRTDRVEVPGWPAELAGLRVAVLADLHVGSPYRRLDREEKRTLYVLYVSSGVGTSILPVRLLAPPEITVLELAPAPLQTAPPAPAPRSGASRPTEP